MAFAAACRASSTAVEAAPEVRVRGEHQVHPGDGAIRRKVGRFQPVDEGAITFELELAAQGRQVIAEGIERLLELRR